MLETKETRVEKGCPQSRVFFTFEGLCSLALSADTLYSWARQKSGKF